MLVSSRGQVVQGFGVQDLEEQELEFGFDGEGGVQGYRGSEESLLLSRTLR